MSNEQNMQGNHSLQACWMISILLQIYVLAWAKWPTTNSEKFFFYAEFVYTNGIDTISCFEPYSTYWLRKQGYEDESCFDKILMSGMAVLVSDSVMHAKRGESIVPSEKVDSIIVQDGLTALLVESDKDILVMDTYGLSISELNYYMSLLFRQGYYFYQDDETGYYVLIK